MNIFLKYDNLEQNSHTICFSLYKSLFQKFSRRNNLFGLKTGNITKKLKSSIYRKNIVKKK